MEQQQHQQDEKQQQQVSQTNSSTLATPPPPTPVSPPSSSFLSHAPRDASEGLAEGLKSIALGVGAGVAGLVGMPLVGARNEGVSGFFKGLGAGVLGAVVLPTMGVVNGVMEIGGGIVNTPESVSARMEGRVWDENQRKWVRYDLTEEAARVFKEEKEDEEKEKQERREKEKKKGEGGKGGGVKDLTYYTLLEVETTATAEEIKKAYYKKARGCHPDRHPGDAEAHAKFQALSHAYHVLSSDSLRAAYDREGAEAAGLEESMPSLDPALFFTVLFGSEKFEPYVGRLKLSHLVSAFGENLAKATAKVKAEGEGEWEGKGKEEGEGGEGRGEEGKGLADLGVAWDGGEKAVRMQTAREVRCALHLIKCLEPFVEAGGEGGVGVEGFHRWMVEEAAGLCQGTFGPQMLLEVGWVYANIGREFLGWKDSWWGMEGVWEKVTREAKGLGRRAEVAGAAVGALKAAKTMSDNMGKAEEEKRRRGGAQQKKVEGSKPEGAPTGVEAAAAAATGASSSTATTEATPPPGVDGTTSSSSSTTTTPPPPQDDGPSEAELAALNETIPAFIHVMWKMSQLDIQKTAARAAKKVLRDDSVSEAVRRRRAQGLILLGAHFKQVGKEAMAALKAQGGGEGGTAAVKLDAKHLEEVMMKTMAMGQGQEV